MKNESYEIRDDFIGIFDNFFPEELIDRYIDYFQTAEEMGMVRNRQQTCSPQLRHKVDDESIEVLSAPFYINELNTVYVSRHFLEIFWNRCYKLYVEKFSALTDVANHSIYDMKVQRTVPGQGYHIWHCEFGNKSTRDRILAFTLYLNDVEDGGETEFLYQKTRIKPQRNRLLIWPAGFTHTHRGNPPLAGEKFIITGWVELGV